MAIITMSIELDALAERAIADLASALGLTVVDQRPFERKIAERSDRVGRQKRFNVLPSIYRKLWGATGQQLSYRLQEEALEIATRGNVLILSWVAPVTLRSISQVIRIRVRAPVAVREEAAMRRLGYHDPRMAGWEVNSVDGLITRFLRSMFDVDWRDGELYDLVFDATRISETHWRDLVMNMAQSRSFRGPAPFAELDRELHGLHLRELGASHALHAAPEVVVGTSRLPLADVHSHEEAIAKIENHLHHAQQQPCIDLRNSWQREV